MKRPSLNKIPLTEAIPFRRGRVTLTMSVGQWTQLHQAAYDKGFILVELDESENPIAAYQRHWLPHSG